MLAARGAASGVAKNSACSDCIAAGSLPSHGAYDKALAKKYEERYLKSATSRPATEAASEDQIVSQKRLEDWLASGADINAELSNAVSAFAPDRVKFLISKGADVNKLNDNGYAPLHTAARSRNSVDSGGAVIRLITPPSASEP